MGAGEHSSKAIDLRLPVDPRSARAARHSLDGLKERISEDALFRFQLAVSELVTNAVLHGGTAGDLRLVVRVLRDRIRTEVIDPGPGFTKPFQDLDPERESGRGLLLVSASTDRWGFSRTDATRIWFEIDLRPSSPTASFAA